MLMIVFDVTNETSFQNCSKWLERVDKVRKQKGDVPGEYCTWHGMG